MSEETESANSQTAEGAEAPKPRRRRRTKAEIEADRAAAEAAAAAGEPAPKPRRTRVKKSEGKDAQKAAEKTAEKSAEPAAELRQDKPAAPVADAEAERKPRRRPGRPRKSEVAAAEATAEPPAEVEKGEPKPDSEKPADAPAEAPKRRRGRPRKSEAVQGDVADLNRVAQEVTSASSVPTEAPSQTLPVEKPEASAPAADTQLSAEAQPADFADGSESEGSHGRRRNRRNRDRNREDGFQGQQGDRGDRNDRNGRRRDRNRNRNRQQQVVEPSLSREALAEMKVADLRAKAAELEVDYVGVHKPELIEAIYAAAAAGEGFRSVDGVLELGNEGFGWVRTGNYMEGDDDAFVPAQMVRNVGLRPGDRIVGTVGPNRGNSKYPPVTSVTSVNGRSPEGLKARPRFRDLTPIFPNERLTMEHGRDSVTGRAIDLVAPIGKGQRGLIVSPPKAGKTTVLKHICQSIAANNPEVHLFCLLVDERPEEVTDMERSIKGEVVASTFDMPAENHTHVSELVIEHAKRLVELGEDVVVVLDSITRLARAYNLAQPASGRILSGGVDSAALYPPKKFLGAARNIENGGSLTIIASALVDTGSKMDEVIFEEFKGTGNMELKLDRDLADRRIFPAIDPVSSGTRNEDLLIDAMYQPLVWGIRRILANMNNTERAANALVKGIKGTETNEEFLIRSAKKAQQSEYLG